MPSQKKLRIMISSTVYGNESILEQIYAVLSGYGYEVWMSHKGTLPTNPNKTTTDNCLEAVANCDVYLGIITKRYGSVDSTGISITHQEVKCSIAKAKLRWFLVHYDVTVAHDLLRQFRFDAQGAPISFPIQPTRSLENIGILDMYDDVAGQKTGNWIQPYHNEADILNFISSQFSDVAGIRQMLRGTP